MSVEQRLAGWAGPSSDTEQERQERTERMIRAAIREHRPFAECHLNVFVKGSYANNTNVRADSDVDVAVECTDAVYWDEAVPGLHTPTGTYAGLWTPARLRQELSAALTGMFGDAVNTSGSTAIRVHSNTARVDADVVPCFSYRYYVSQGSTRPGTKIFKTDGGALVNYPEQQLVNGRNKNQRTGNAYKKTVRILKRIENSMVQSEGADPLASYLVECLTYNCPDFAFMHPTWTETVRAVLANISHSLQGDEPTDPAQRWHEANECFYLFHANQKWKRIDSTSFARAAWIYLGLA